MSIDENALGIAVKSWQIRGVEMLRNGHSYTVEESVRIVIEAYEAAKSSEQPVGLTERVARAIAVSIYHSEGLETMNYAGEQDYADKEWQHYEREANAAVTECCRAKIIDGEMLCRKCGYTARATADQPVKENADSSHVPATCKENPSDIIGNVKMAIGKALIPDGIWNIDEGRKLEGAAKAAIACIPKRESGDESYATVDE